MPYGTKQKYIETLLITMTEAVQEQEKHWKRGFITEVEKTEVINAIIEKTAAMIQTL